MRNPDKIPSSPEMIVKVLSDEDLGAQLWVSYPDQNGLRHLIRKPDKH